ncbi:serine/threonine-protein kinase [Nocardioides bizhenqiangii]|uniref:non-specific serine/threonine protein kinase n=1 Tax=Nocardioides bizhenqiangii TaxID=3095076 RepID=A0ABZ0ZS96_9ACTN|nr:serine/threonine protein kinase [Nocardioides sp. HM61]WQQ26656.1 serine/threonine protein kinase [Nocardioides sp. HM61]
MTDQPGQPEQFADEAHRYRLDSRIATGGMGVVWRATDTRLNRPVAVKVLKHEYADDPQFRTRFDTEARNAAALQHPGIAGVFDYSSDPGGPADSASPYLVMELVEGQPLSALLVQARDAGRTLDPAVVRDLLTQTADALAVAHRAAIVHRDVKPANLIVTPDRRVKVTDFGIARAADDAQITRTGAVMGTPQYLSPEQARGNPSTPASDVYSLGVVGFECLTGRRPFEADSPVATALAHLQQPVPDLPDDLPEDLRTIVRRALAKDPAERYADGAELAAALRGAEVGMRAAAAPPDDATAVLPATPAQPVAPVPVGAEPPTGPTHRLDRAVPFEGEEPKKRDRRNVLPIVLIVLLLVAAAIAAVVLLLGQDDDEPSSSNDDRSPSRRTSQATTATSETSESEPTTPETSEDTAVFIDADDYIGRDVAEVERELQLLGLRPRLFEDANPGGETEDEVLSVNPAGELNEGDTVDVHYWGPPPAPETTPTTETTPPDETTSTETVTSLSTEGDNG